MNNRLIPALIALTLASLACTLTSPAPALTPTTAADSAPASPAPKPTAPAQGIAAKPAGPGSVFLTWKATPGAEKYLIELQVGDEFLPVAVVPASDTSFQAENLPPDSPWTYRVSALVSGKKQGGQEVTVETQAQKSSPIQVEFEFDRTAALTFDPATFDPSKIDPNTFDPSQFIPQPIQAEQVIGPQGGALSVTGSSGVVYTLSVPPRALRAETTLRLRPLASIADLPLSGGLTAAALIEPDTLAFDIPATLEMTPPADFPPAAGPLTLAFAFEADGSDFHLYPLDPASGQTSAARQLAALNFIPRFAPPPGKVGKVRYGGGYGLGSGTPADAKKVLKSTPANPQNRADQQAAANQNDELTPLVSPQDNDLTPLPVEQIKFGQQGESIRQKAAQADDLGTLMQALDEFNTYLTSGGDKYNARLNNKILETLAAKANALLQKNKIECISADDIAAGELVERLANPQGPVSTQLAQVFKDKYGSKLIDDLANGVKNCAYELSMTSKMTFQAEGSTLHPTATFEKLLLYPTYVKGQAFLSGTGTMKLTGKVTGSCSYSIDQYDTLTFWVQKLVPIYKNGKLTDFNLLRYAVLGWTGPKVTGSAQWSKKCPTLVTITGGGDYWTPIFTLSRLDKPVYDWKVDNQLTKAKTFTATWALVRGPFTPMGGASTGGVLTEDTRLLLKVTKR